MVILSRLAVFRPQTMRPAGYGRREIYYVVWRRLESRFPRYKYLMIQEQCLVPLRFSAQPCVALDSHSPPSYRV
jgi:hypothetical protein